MDEKTDAPGASPTLPKERKRRRDAGTTLITKRDLQVLVWIAEQYAARLDHVRELLSRTPGRNARPDGITLSAVLQVIERWTTLDLVEYQRIYDGEPGWIWVTPHGLNVLRLSYTRLHPRPSTLPHLYAINRVRLSVERRHPEYRWVSERTLRAALPRREAGEQVPHLPDAQVWNPKPIAVEVELSEKKSHELDEILTGLLITGTSTVAGESSIIYTTVWYFVTPQTHRSVEDARARLADEFQTRVQIIPLESLR
jgi:hypothetical protein